MFLCCCDLRFSCILFEVVCPAGKQTTGAMSDGCVAYVKRRHPREIQCLAGNDEREVSSRAARCKGSIRQLSTLITAWLVASTVRQLARVELKTGAVAVAAAAAMHETRPRGAATNTRKRRHRSAFLSPATEMSNRENAQSPEELRRTIEESVLNVLAASIRQHGEKVESGERPARPFVTLTYAQSIDGSIAAVDRSQV